MKKFTFKQIFAFAIVTILAGCLVAAFATDNKDLVNMLVVALVGALGTIMTFFFKHEDGDGGSK
ncbi:hypothetical protein COLU111180_12675 [Cohnella lubricantis]|uniref:Lipoprotein n=1 Tax=Cohnella lubricantis TaxID=2163172 RepID=A0A841T7X7_9BACL|nr:hypothetical protein [Cohnella lubricantis]MBB6677424.1 hypothetical protein [Cohnella lubricantis]MBP2117528.1 putative membrane protein [Cohnella lubricantis]